VSKHFRSVQELKNDPATRDEVQTILAAIGDLAANHDLVGGTDPEAEARLVDAIDRFVSLSERR
jgi:hypothetical protein